MHEQAISSVRTTALRSVIAMQQESRFVDREEDDCSDRPLFQWVAPRCGEDECSASFKDKRKQFVSYVSEEACAKHMINHLYGGWAHRKYKTWQTAADCVNEFIALNPTAAAPWGPPPASSGRKRRGGALDERLSLGRSLEWFQCDTCGRWCKQRGRSLKQ